MKAPDDVVFLLDVDNTLLDNDRVHADLRARLAREFGPENRDRYWDIFEALRTELGLGALQRYRIGAMNDPRLLLMSSFLVDHPFADRLYRARPKPASIRRPLRWHLLSRDCRVLRPTARSASAAKRARVRRFSPSMARYEQRTRMTSFRLCSRGRLRRGWVEIPTKSTEGLRTSSVILFTIASRRPPVQSEKRCF